VLCQSVEGLSRGVYEVDLDAHALRLTVPQYDGRLLLECVQGQYWALGSGAVIFLGTSWDALETAYGEGPDAYVSALLDMGRCAQAIVLSLTGMNAGAWMTPALDEEKAARLCNIDEAASEALYMLKIGPRKIEGELRESKYAPGEPSCF
jgi:hypothetical protein